MRLDIDQPPVDLPVGGPAVDRGDRELERPVVEDGAVDEGRHRRIDVGAQMVLERLGDEFLAARPGRPSQRDRLVHLDNPGRRECARE